MHTKKKKEVNNASTCSGGCTAPIFTDGAAARSELAAALTNLIRYARIMHIIIITTTS
jgi:hypothetical protein